MVRQRLSGAVVVALLVGAMSVPADAASLRPKLLVLSDFPHGWLVSGGSSTEFSGCNASVFPAGSTKKVSAGFNYLTLKGFPLVSEVLGLYANSSTAFHALTLGLAGCTHVSGTAHGSTFTGTLSPMHFPKYDNQSAAFVGRINLGGSILAVDILVVRKGSELMELEEGNFTSVSSSEFHQFAADAVSRL